MRFLFVDVFMERIKLMIPLSLFASMVFCYLVFSKNGLFNAIETKVVKISLRVVAYTLIILLATMFFIFMGMILLFGSLGIPVLLAVDVFAIVLLIRRIILSRKNKLKAENETKARVNYMKVI